MREMKNTKHKIKKKKHLSQRGVVLVWAVFIASILIILSTTMTILVIKELKVSSNMDESNRAYTAAESGMERILYEKALQVEAKDNWFCGEDDADDEDDPWIDPVNNDNQINRVIGAASEGLSYDASISCYYVSGNKVMSIESTGISHSITKRKLKTTLVYSSRGQVDTYDTNAAIGGIFTEYNPQDRDPVISIHGWMPLIVQQFDLMKLSVDNIGPDIDDNFMVGMRDITGLTSFGIKFTRLTSGRVGVSLASNYDTDVMISGEVPDVPSQNNFDFIPDPGKIYRVRVEYSRHGILASGYTVVRATIKERLISSPFDDPSDTVESWICINDSDNPATVYAAIEKRGDDIDFVSVWYGEWKKSIDGTDKYIGVGSDFNSDVDAIRNVKLDNMIIWGRE